MINLSERQKRFLRAAYEKAPAKNTLFYWPEVGATAGYTEDVASDIVRELANTTPPVINVFAEKQAALAAGREIARQMVEDEAAERTAKRWSIAAKVWAVVMSLAVPITVAYVNRRLQRADDDTKQKLEQLQRQLQQLQQQAATSPPAAPAPAPTSAPALPSPPSPNP